MSPSDFPIPSVEPEPAAIPARAGQRSRDSRRDESLGVGTGLVAAHPAEVTTADSVKARLFDVLVDGVAERMLQRLAPLLEGARPSNQAREEDWARFTKEEAAERLGISVRKLERVMKDGEISYYKDGDGPSRGGSVSFSARQLREYLETREVSPARAGQLARSARSAR